MILTRRNFLKGGAGLVAAFCAPAIVRSESLMPIHPLMVNWRHGRLDQFRFIDNATGSDHTAGQIWQSNHGGYLHSGELADTLREELDRQYKNLAFVRPRFACQREG